MIRSDGTLNGLGQFIHIRHTFSLNRPTQNSGDNSKVITTEFKLKASKNVRFYFLLTGEAQNA